MMPVASNLAKQAIGIRKNIATLLIEMAGTRMRMAKNKIGYFLTPSF